MNCDIHNVVKVTSKCKRVMPDESRLREPYFVHTLEFTTRDHTGNESVDAVTLYSRNDDECQVTLFPSEDE